MPLVLIVEENDRERRISLEPGELILGSGADVDIRLSHPTVSRRHARARVESDVLRLEDLGSSNGTRLDGKAIEGPTSWRPGTRATFGTLETRLEIVDSDELTAAVLLNTTAPSDEAQRVHHPTMSVGSLRDFTFSALPAILERVEEDADPEQVVRQTGAALLEVLPCVRVEVRSGTTPDAGLVFAGGDSEPPTPFVVERTVHELVFRVVFDDRVRAEGFEPLVDLATRLTALRTRSPSSVQPGAERPRPAARPPDPPSVEPAVRKVYADATRIAPSDVGVLIIGESGTGKEVLAHFLHGSSDRREAPFVALNCAALPQDLLEAELFGVERGVATGVDARPGKFEAADGGTLFLDEIGDMAPATQARILRVLQEREVFRIGGRVARPAQVRIVAATNRDLAAMVEDGSFRLDLFHRIADWTVELPPLRRRRRDIVNLAAHFLGSAARKRGVRARGISTAAMDVLAAFDWPGNIRQLEREMQRAVLFLEDDELLQSRHLQATIRSGPSDSSVENGSLKAQLEAYERRVLRNAIAAVDGNLTAAAKTLGIGRSTLYRRLAELGIET